MLTSLVLTSSFVPVLVYLWLVARSRWLFVHGGVSSLRREIFGFGSSYSLQCSLDGVSGARVAISTEQWWGGRRRVGLGNIGGVLRWTGVRGCPLLHNDGPIIPWLLIVCICTGCCNVLPGRLATTTIDHCCSFERVRVAFVAVAVFVDLDDNTPVEGRVQLCCRGVCGGTRAGTVRSYSSLF